MHWSERLQWREKDIFYFLSFDFRNRLFWWRERAKEMKIAFLIHRVEVKFSMTMVRAF
jgi:hypothetical protein